MKRLISIIALILVCVTPAFALSDAEYLKMKKDPEFAQADRELTRAYNDAKGSMTKSEFAKLKKLQRQWIADGRDRHAKNLMREGYSKTEAYAEATRVRTREIRNEMTLSSLSVDDVQGYYDNGDDIYLFIGWKNRAKKLLEVSLSCDGEDWKGTGTLRGDTIIANYGGTSVTVKIIDNDTVEITPNSAFRRAVGFDADDTYKRHYGK